jgi:predicted nucleotidyltransferase
MLERIVILTGIDGSGKTRHAQTLVSDYLRMGEECSYIWMRTAYFFSLPFMVICRLIGFASMKKLPNGKNSIEHRYYSKPISLIWPWVQFVDLLLFLMVRVYTRFMSRNIVVADRFIHDILVDLMVDVDNPHLHQSLVGKLILRLIPSGSITILFDADEQTALQRKSDTPSLQYLTTRRQKYKMLASYLAFSEISSVPPFDVVHEGLLDEIKVSRSAFAMRVIDAQLINRLQARARWKKWKKGPVAIAKRLIKKVLSAFIDRYEVKEHVNKNQPFNKEMFEKNLNKLFIKYFKLLQQRGLNVHSIVLLGSWAKNRGHAKSDLDIIVVATGLPTGPIGRILRNRKLTEFPLFLGIEPYGYTKQEFLECITHLDLRALDALYCGKVLFDNGFWQQAQENSKLIEEKYLLKKEELSMKLSLI